MFLKSFHELLLKSLKHIVRDYKSLIQCKEFLTSDLSSSNYKCIISAYSNLLIHSFYKNGVQYTIQGLYLYMNVVCLAVMMVINQFVESLFTAGNHKDSEVPFDNYFNVHIKNIMSSQSVPLFALAALFLRN